MPTKNPTQLEAIDALAFSYKKEREFLVEELSDLKTEIAEIHKRHRAALLRAVSRAKQAKDDLLAAVKAAPELFEKPRSLTLHDIKVGYKQGSGRLSWEDEDAALVARIEKIFAKEPEQLALLINTTKKPSKDGLKTLEAKQLARLGIEVEGTGDEPFLTVPDSAVDKLVAKLLEEGKTAEEDAA